MRWMLFCVQSQSQKQDVCKRFVCVFACVSTHTVESFLSFFRVLCAVTSLFSSVGSPLSLFVFVCVFFFGDSAVFCVLFFHSFIHLFLVVLYSISKYCSLKYLYKFFFISQVHAELAQSDTLVSCSWYVSLLLKMCVVFFLSIFFFFFCFKTQNTICKVTSFFNQQNRTQAFRDTEKNTNDIRNGFHVFFISSISFLATRARTHTHTLRE